MLNQFSKVKCFGEKCALTAEIGATSKNVTCINLEVAHRVQAATPGGLPSIPQGKSYDWKEKVVFQLDLEDMNLLAGVLLGFKKTYSVIRDTKQLHIARQQNQGTNNKYAPGIYFKASDGLHLLISPGGAIELCQLILRVIEMLTGCQPSYVLASIKGGCSLE